MTSFRPWLPNRRFEHPDRLQPRAPSEPTASSNSNCRMTTAILQPSYILPDVEHTRWTSTLNKHKGFRVLSNTRSWLASTFDCDCFSCSSEPSRVPSYHPFLMRARAASRGSGPNPDRFCDCYSFCLRVCPVYRPTETAIHTRLSATVPWSQCFCSADDSNSHVLFAVGHVRNHVLAGYHWLTGCPVLLPFSRFMLFSDCPASRLQSHIHNSVLTWTRY